MLARWVLFMSLMAGLLMSGCWPGYLRLQIEAPPKVNQGLPLHVVVRAVEAPQYVLDTRIAVGNLLAGSDPSVIEDLVVLAPAKLGWKRALWIKKPEKKALGVYVLFAVPQGTWKVLLEAPVPLRLKLSLRQQSIAPVAGSGGRVLPFL